MHQPWQHYVPNKNLPIAIKTKTQDITKIKKKTKPKPKNQIEWEWERKTPREGKFGMVVLCKGEFSLYLHSQLPTSSASSAFYLLQHPCTGSPGRTKAVW